MAETQEFRIFKRREDMPFPSEGLSLTLHTMYGCNREAHAFRISYTYEPTGFDDYSSFGMLLGGVVGSCDGTCQSTLTDDVFVIPAQ